jgi:CRISPR/Cas system-associated exonuclease Cas4 (RecB family)
MYFQCPRECKLTLVVLAAAIEKAQSNKLALERETRKTLRRLRNQLESTRLELRATQVVSVVSRVEASRADAEFKAALNSVADKVASAGDKINQHLRTAIHQLTLINA